jgi:hypothetical protein
VLTGSEIPTLSAVISAAPLGPARKIASSPMKNAAHRRGTPKPVVDIVSSRTA